MAAAIVVEGLRKRFGDVQAVAGVDLEVASGEVLALLGPNGAGKTTTVEILEGYKNADSGRVSVLGLDPAKDRRRLLERIGIVLQECAVEPFLTVSEVLDRRAASYPHPRKTPEVIALVGLGEKAGARVRTLSGGQQRRLDLGLALVGDPELLFLDEPTTGFDPGARREAWEVVRQLAGQGRTVLLTTHYMDEAQALADRVAVIARGVIVAAGTTDSIGGRDRGSAKVRFSVPEGVAAKDLPIDAEYRTSTEPDGTETVEVDTAEPTALLSKLTTWAVERSLELASLEVTRASLEDVYLSLTREDAP